MLVPVGDNPFGYLLLLFILRDGKGTQQLVMTTYKLLTFLSRGKVSKYTDTKVNFSDHNAGLCVLLTETNYHYDMIRKTLDCKMQDQLMPSFNSC